MNVSRESFVANAECLSFILYVSNFDVSHSFGTILSFWRIKLEITASTDVTIV
jgi:hypothetical protein